MLALRLPNVRLPRVSPRGVLLGVPAAVAGAVAAVFIQALYAGHRPLPSFEGVDPSGTFGEAGLPEVRIALLGDSSITAPGLDDPDDIWIRQIARRLSSRYHIELVSFAVGGSKAKDVIADQLDVAVASKPDLCIVSVGANDALRSTPMSRLRTELDEIVGRLLEASELVLLCGVGDLNNMPRLPFLIGAVAGARSRAADRVHAKVAAASERVVKIPLKEVSDDRFRRDPNLFSPDLFHPNAAGHTVWAQAGFPTVATAVSQVLRARGATAVDV